MLLFLASQAFPCGGFIPVRTKLVGSDAQQAFFELAEDNVTVTYRVRYAGDAESFAWIIPVPGPVESVTEGDEATFEALELGTAPTAQYDKVDHSPAEEPGLFGCESDTRTKGFNAPPVESSLEGVVVTGEGFAGDFAYVTLEASVPNAMLGWLAENGYDSSVSQSAIEQYENDPIGFTWAAVKLAPSTPQTADGGVLLQPLRIRYTAAADGNLHLRYPARMGSTSMLDEFRTEIYVLAPNRVEPKNGWSMGQNTASDSGFDIQGDQNDNPEDLFEMLIRTSGSQTAFWPTYGNAWLVDGEYAGYLTRYDAITAPGVNLTDIAFTETDDSDSTIRTLVSILKDKNSSGSGLLLVPVGMLAMAWRLRRRTVHGR